MRYLQRLVMMAITTGRVQMKKLLRVMEAIHPIWRRRLWGRTRVRQKCGRTQEAHHVPYRTLSASLVGYFFCGRGKLETGEISPKPR
jgi:hypothetical protein